MQTKSDPEAQNIANKPLLHFAHANGFVSSSYHKMLTALEPYYTCECLEKIGHNPEFPVTTGWPHLVEELKASVEAAQQKHTTQQPIIGIGHSLGGVLTLMCAVKYPHLFSQIILMEPPLNAGSHSLILQLARWTGQGDKFSPARASKHRRVTFDSHQQVLTAFQANPFFKRFDPDCLKDYVTHGFTENADGSCSLAFNREIEVAIFRTFPLFSSRFAKKIQKTAVASHLIIGTNSDLTQRGILPKVIKSSKINHSTFDGTHMFPLEKPQATAEYLHKLIQQTLNSTHTKT